jgi:hypothetical protein
MRSLFTLLVLALLPACGSSEDEPRAEAAARDAGRQADMALASAFPARQIPPNDEPPASDEATDSPSTGTLFVRKDWQDGERFEVRSRAEIKLDAEVGVGFLSTDVSYRVEEEEILLVDILPPEDDEGWRRKFHYKERHSTRVQPIVGKKKKDGRVAGKTFLLAGSSAGPIITRENGNSPSEKLDRDVRFTQRILGPRPVFFGILPEGPEPRLEPGERLQLEADIARRVVGLPFDQMNVDSMQLTLREPAEQFPRRAVFDAEAAFSGSGDVGGSQLSMTANLRGTVTVDTATMRIMRVELKGRVKLRQDGDATVAANGSGPLVIRRLITALE